MIRDSPLLQFMEEHYEILPPAPITGPFRIDNSRWLAEIAFALCDPTIREVTTQLAAQGGKNLIAEGFISYTLIHAPGNILYYGQTDEDAEMFATSRALKRARGIPVLKNIWPDTKGAAKNNQVHLAHLALEFLGANPSNARGKSAPYLICDEKHLKQWQGMGKIVRKRVSAFWDHKILNISTAGDEGSEIDLDYQRGSMEDWHLGCPACQRSVRLTWSQEVSTIVWETTPEGFALMHPAKGKWNFREVRKHVRFRCPYEDCKCEERDSMPVRREMNRLGCYIADNPDASPDHRSFHASQIAYPWVSWESIVEEWIGAMEQAKTGDLTNLRTFIIETMGHTWKKQVSTPSQAHITGGYKITDVDFAWEDEADRFACVDVQERGGRHFWLVFRAWAASGESRLIYACRAETWAHVEKLVEQYQVKAKRVGVDSKYATQEVKEQCALRGWHYLSADMTRNSYEWLVGSAKVLRPYQKSQWADTRKPEPGKGRRYAHGIIFSKRWVRQVIANRIAGQGSEWGIPDDVSNLIFPGTSRAKSSYMAQLNSWVEKEVPVKATGEVKKQWVQINSDDHLRSCEEMQLVLAAVSGYIPSELTQSKEEN